MSALIDFRIGQTAYAFGSHHRRNFWHWLGDGAHIGTTWLDSVRVWPARWLHVDITDPASVQAMCERVQAQTTTLQGLVNCAGINVPAALEHLPIDRLQHQFAVNTFGTLRVTQACLPLLREGRGRVVNVSSVMGEVAMPLLGAYSMSKHALEAMSDVLRLELRPSGIRVSVVQMGAVQTPMTDHMGDLVDRAQHDLNDTQRAQTAWLYDGMRRALQTQARSAIPAQHVADVVVHALTAKRPKERYRVGVASWGLSLMQRLAPEAIRDWILRRALGLKP
jgi:NAD(P)-dependent dehydrogenase (short-subunit alcohol dehydrogenase family)